MATATEVIVQVFYRDFFQRDILGLVVPGGSVLVVFAWAYQVDPAPLTTIATVWKVLFFPAFIAVAYIVGLAVQAAGVRVWLVRYYPFFERKGDFHSRLSELKKQFGDKPAVLAQRERYVALKQASGNSSVAALLIAGVLQFGPREPTVPVWPVWVLATLLTLAHLETTYNQRSWEVQALKQPLQETAWDAFFSYHVLLAAWHWISRLTRR